MLNIAYYHASANGRDYALADCPCLRRPTYYGCTHGGYILFLQLLAYISLRYNDFDTSYSSV